MCDSMNCSFSDSVSLSEFSIKDKKNIELIQEDEQLKDYPLRCPICFRIPRFYGDFEKNYFYTLCDNQHKNEYDSFDSFFKQSNKENEIPLCHLCQDTINDYPKAYCCITCNFFICSKCKNRHEEEKGHLNFIELNKIDTYCPRHNMPYKYYDCNKKSNLCENCLVKGEDKKNIIETSNHINYKETFSDNSKKVKENIIMWNNIYKLANEWLVSINEKFNVFLNSIQQYITLQGKIISYLSNENNFEKYENNFNVFFNYEIINNERIDKFIKNINNKINNNYIKDGDSIITKSKFFISLLDHFLKKEIKIETKKNILLESEKNKSPKIKYMDERNRIKIENMDKNKYDLKSKIKCMIPFDNQKMLVIGFINGKIKIYEENKEKKANENKLNKKLTIKAFENEISNICELDRDLIIASDIKNNIKIIQINENMTEYSVIQELNLKEDSGDVHTIANLSMISYYKNRHYFCIGDDNHLLIFKSNKMPKNMSPPALNYHEGVEEYSIVQPSFSYSDNIFNLIKNNNNENNEKSSKDKPLSFELIKDIALNTQVSYALEVNETYIAVACPKSNKIKFFDTHKDFKEVISLPNISVYEGNCTMCTSKDRTNLFIACVGGFCMVSLKNLKKINKIHMNQSIKCLDFYNKECLTCISLKGEEYFVKQYLFKNGFMEISKFSEQRIYSNQEVIWAKVINNKIFYLDETYSVHYYNIC